MTVEGIARRDVDTDGAATNGAAHHAGNGQDLDAQETQEWLDSLESVLFREGLVRLLEDAGIEIAAQARDAHELRTSVEREQPDVAIVDVRMPPTHTDEGTKVAKELKLGAGPEFRDRKDGLPGLKAKYGIEFKEDLQMAIGLRYQALANKQIDVVNGYATDGMISAMKLKRLKDDKNLWPPYYLVPVVRKDALDANPKIADVLNQVDALLDETTMAEMNYKVDNDKEEPKDVARAFLKAKGIVR